MRHVAGVALVCALAAAALSAVPAQERIRFAAGRSSARIEGAVLRGERNTYVLGARAGQRMSVRIRSLEKNAVFSVYPPGSTKPLPGTEEAKDAAAWSGTLPKRGDYRIVVGSTRGNAGYVLSVSILPRPRVRRSSHKGK